jgi:hypothetical protein
MLLYQVIYSSLFVYYLIEKNNGFFLLILGLGVLFSSEALNIRPCPFKYQFLRGKIAINYAVILYKLKSSSTALMQLHEVLSEVTNKMHYFNLLLRCFQTRFCYLMNILSC